MGCSGGRDSAVDTEVVSEYIRVGCFQVELSTPSINNHETSSRVSTDPFVKLDLPTNDGISSGPRLVNDQR